jgi:hypothetical protein
MLNMRKNLQRRTGTGPYGTYGGIQLKILMSSET